MQQVKGSLSCISPVFVWVLLLLLLAVSGLNQNITQRAEKALSVFTVVKVILQQAQQAFHIRMSPMYNKRTSLFKSFQNVLYKNKLKQESFCSSQILPVPHPLLVEMEPVIQVQNVLLKGRHLLQLEVFCFFFIYFYYLNILDFENHVHIHENLCRGSSSGSCASSFGVCCIFEKSCGGAAFRGICIMQHRPVHFLHLSQFLFAYKKIFSSYPQHWQGLFIINF